MPKPESKQGSASRKSRKPGSKKQFASRKKPAVKKKAGAKKTAAKKSGGKKSAGKKKTPTKSKKTTKKPSSKTAGSKGSKKVRPASEKKPSASPKRGRSKVKKPVRKTGRTARPAAAKTGRKPKKTTTAKKGAASAAVTLRRKAPKPKTAKAASGAVTLAKRGGKRGAASGAVTMGRKAPRPKAGKAASGAVTLARPGAKKGAASGSVTMKQPPAAAGTKKAASGTVTRSEPDSVSHRKAPRSSDRGAGVQAVPGPVSEHREWLSKPMPETYGESKIVCMVKDPYWLFAYWDVQEKRLEEAARTSRTAGKNPKLTLRVNRLGEGDPAGPVLSHHDIEIVGFTKSWYIDVGVPDQSFSVEIGVKDDSGNFVSIARSNAVKTPSARISGVESAEWRSIPEAMEMGGEFVPGVSVFGSETVRRERYKKFGPASDTAPRGRSKK